jgi:hypothetical protein
MTPAIVMHNKGTGRAVRRACACGLIALAAGAASGCGDMARQGQASSYLQVTELVAANGAKPDEFGGTLYSDVITIQEGVASTYSDLAKVTLALAMKDPGGAGLPTEPSSANYITITRYRVRYVRADGRNTPGVDVPYPFDGGLTFTVGKGETTSPGFEVVRHVAKYEAPLAALGANGIVITTLAEVTFYGQDQAGRAASVKGTIGVNFANYADPE